MFDYSKETGAKVLVYRFPNVFGKWCRPNYNSAVATFCNNIAHDLPIRVNDSWTGTTRILRARVTQLCQLPFVKIEKALGVRDGVIMVKHLIPNLKDIILTRAALAVSSAMMSEAGLSFLGLGDYGEKSWGSILHYAFYQNGVIRGYYWWYLPPILCTSLAVLGCMLLGYYGLRNRR